METDEQRMAESGGGGGGGQSGPGQCRNWNNNNMKTLFTLNLILLSSK